MTSGDPRDWHDLLDFPTLEKWSDLIPSKRLTAPNDMEDINPFWRGKSSENVDRHLEQLIIDVVPDEKLPLLMNNKWVFKSNEEKFKERIKNAKIPS